MDDGRWLTEGVSPWPLASPTKGHLPIFPPWLARSARDARKPVTGRAKKGEPGDPYSPRFDRDCHACRDQGLWKKAPPCGCRRLTYTHGGRIDVGESVKSSQRFGFSRQRRVCEPVASAVCVHRRLRRLLGAFCCGAVRCVTWLRTASFAPSHRIASHCIHPGHGGGVGRLHPRPTSASRERKSPPELKTGVVFAGLRVCRLRCVWPQWNILHGVTYQVQSSE